MEEESRWNVPREVCPPHHADMASQAFALERKARHTLVTRTIRSATLAVVVSFCLAGSSLWRHASRDVSAAKGGSWSVELSAAGLEPVTALAYGREAGLHLVTVPGRDAPLEERRRLPVRLAAGNVYFVSLGRTGLTVHSESPSDSPRISLSAQSRFVTLFQSARVTGIATSWHSAR